MVKEKYSRLVHAFAECNIKLRGLTEGTTAVESVQVSPSTERCRITTKLCHIIIKCCVSRAMMNVSPQDNLPFWTVSLAPRIRMPASYEKHWKCSTKMRRRSYANDPWKGRWVIFAMSKECQGTVLPSLHWLPRNWWPSAIIIIGALPTKSTTLWSIAEESPMHTSTKA